MIRFTSTTILFSLLMACGGDNPSKQSTLVEPEPDKVAQVVLFPVNWRTIEFPHSTANNVILVGDTLFATDFENDLYRLDGSKAWEKTGNKAKELVAIDGGLLTDGGKRSFDLGNSWEGSNQTELKNIQYKANSGDIFATNGNTLLKSNSKGDNWESIKEFDDFIFDFVAINDNHFLLLVGAQDSLTFYDSTTGSLETRMTPDYFQSLEFANGVVFADGALNLYSTSDFGDSWLLRDKKTPLERALLPSALKSSNGQVYFAGEALLGILSEEYKIKEIDTPPLFGTTSNLYMNSTDAYFATGTGLYQVSKSDFDSGFNTDQFTLIGMPTTRVNKLINTEIGDFYSEGARLNGTLTLMTSDQRYSIGEFNVTDILQHSESKLYISYFSNLDLGSGGLGYLDLGSGELTEILHGYLAQQLEEFNNRLFLRYEFSMIDDSNNGVLESVDGGDNWQQVKLPIGVDNVRTIATSSVCNNLSMAVATDSGSKLYELKTDGEWNELYSTEEKVIGHKSSGPNTVFWFDDGFGLSNSCNNQFEITSTAQISEGNITDMLIIEGEPWFVTDDGELIRVEGNTFHLAKNPEEATIQQLFRTSQGEIYIRTENNVRAIE